MLSVVLPGDAKGSFSAIGGRGPLTLSDLPCLLWGHSPSLTPRIFPCGYICPSLRTCHVAESQGYPRELSSVTEIFSLRCPTRTPSPHRNAEHSKGGSGVSGASRSFLSSSHPNFPREQPNSPAKSIHYNA